MMYLHDCFVGNIWPAAEQTEQLADLAELAYGWDSIEVGDLRKQVVYQCNAVNY